MKALMFKSIDIIVRIIKHVYNFRTHSRISFLKTYIYSKWICLHFDKIGKNVKFQKNVILKGFDYITIGDHTRFDNDCIITAWDRFLDQNFTPCLMIGNNCNFGAYNHITCTNKIIIGDNFLSGRWVTITDNSHGNTDRDTLEVPPQNRPVCSRGSVVIGKNVWVGDKVTILPGVSIGDGAVIAANAVVTKNIPSYAVVVGNPAKIVIK